MLNGEIQFIDYVESNQMTKLLGRPFVKTK